MNHYILTRFNWAKGKDKWTEERLELFTKYTFPSVMNQTCKDFKWLIFCDPKTISPWCSELEALNSNLITVIFDEPPHKHEWYNPTQEVLTDFFKPYILGEPGSRVLTTRLDSDDMLAPDFIERIQAGVDPTLTDQVLLCYYGYIMDKEENYYNKRWSDNPFVTAVEILPDIKTAHGANHMRASRISKNILCVDRKPGWVCVVHGDNCRNNLDRRGVRGTPVVVPVWKT